MQHTTPSQAYVGKEVYVGIDVHKRSYVVEARVEQERVKRWTTPAIPEQLAQQLWKYFPGAKIHSVYEAGFSGFVLHRILSQAGIDSIVVHAAAVEVARHNRVKTDKRDAHKLAAQLEAGRLQGIHIPTQTQEQARLLTRTRAQFVQERADLKRKIRMKAHQFGLIGPDDQREMSHRLVKELLSLSASEEFTLVVQASWQVWQTLDEQIAQLEARLQKQAAADANEEVYRSVPGVGFISARVLSNELGDLQRFSNERELFSYTGLTPSEASSGDHRQQGHITKQGNRHIRAILIEVSWRALREDAGLARYYHQLRLRSWRKARHCRCGQKAHWTHSRRLSPRGILPD